MSDKEQLEWEAANGPRYGIAALVSAPLIILGFLFPLLIFGQSDGDADALKRVDDAGVLAYLGVAVQALAYGLLVAALYYLARVVMARSDQALKVLLPLIPIAALLTVAASLINQIDLAGVADDFFASGPRTDARAEDLLENRSSLIAPIGFAGSLALAISFVLLAINGMRTGVLSRFMGILGILAAAVPALIPGAGAIVQLYWIGALGLLFLDRWPNDRGPAWSVVEAIPWPGAADQVRQESEAEPEPELEPEAKPNPRSARKKKKRR